MREIKFRAWDKEEKDFILNAELAYDAHNDVRYKKSGETAWHISAFSDFLNDDYVLMQFTGLKDKNGKEIYEGDKLSCEGVEGEKIRTVVWDNDGACWGLTGNIDLSAFYQDEIEVIGNIYENGG